MEKIWFIIIDGRKEGPFSVEDLHDDKRINPDTLAWKAGLLNWLPIRDIKELQELFKDEPETDNHDDDEEQNIIVEPRPIEDNEVISLRKDPPYLNIWFILALFLIFYTLYLLIK